MLVNGDSLVTTHILSTMLMTGIALFIQIVHYPLFAKVGKEYFEQYMKGHSFLTTFVVSPIMLTELCTGGLLLYRNPEEKAFLIGFIFLAVIWFTTFILQVPRQNILSKGFNQTAFEELIFASCIRTSMWTIRMVVFVFFY